MSKSTKNTYTAQKGAVTRQVNSVRAYVKVIGKEMIAASDAELEQLKGKMSHAFTVRGPSWSLRLSCSAKRSMSQVT